MTEIMTSAIMSWAAVKISGYGYGCARWDKTTLLRATSEMDTTK